MGRSKYNKMTGLVVGGALSSGAGSGSICLAGDTSFSCRMTNFVGMIKNIIFLFILLYIIYFAYKNRRMFFKK